MYTDDGFSARPGKDFSMSVSTGEEASQGELCIVCAFTATAVWVQDFVKCSNII